MLCVSSEPSPRSCKEKKLKDSKILTELNVNVKIELLFCKMSCTTGGARQSPLNITRVIFIHHYLWQNRIEIFIVIIRTVKFIAANQCNSKKGKKIYILIYNILIYNLKGRGEHTKNNRTDTIVNNTRHLGHELRLHSLLRGTSIVSWG